MKKTHPLVEQSKVRLAALGKIESRTQFGGYALTVEKVVFAFINDDSLYLRACEAVTDYAVERPMEPLVYRKRGIPVVLNYFKVDNWLWQEPERLMRLSASALRAARDELETKYVSLRLKD